MQRPEGSLARRHHRPGRRAMRSVGASLGSRFGGLQRIAGLPVGMLAQMPGAAA